MTVVVRFAPSPTGMMHIGSARTALFNWLYARHNNGKFLVRIEDTDVKRSTPEAVDLIFASLKWLNLDYDGEPIFQMQRQARHRQVAEEMIARGAAYRCYATHAELEAMRAEAEAAGHQRLYNGMWRDRDPSTAPKDVQPTIRLRAPLTGETVVDDMIQGTVRVPNTQLDDMILVRSDGAPTYMLSVVVDDFDTGVTHIIRGDDHLTNTFRQLQIYQAMGWTPPRFAHMPMVFAPEGGKLSKRHGKSGLDLYINSGYLPEAMFNYLMRMGWSHGNQEIFSREEAIQLFDIADVGQSPAKLDFDKLNSLNAHYLRTLPRDEVLNRWWPLIEQLPHQQPLSPHAKARVELLWDELKQRIHTMPELVEQIGFLLYDIAPALPTDFVITDAVKAALQTLHQQWQSMPQDAWTHDNLFASIKQTAQAATIKPPELMKPLRVILTGSISSPAGIASIPEALGQSITLERMKSAI